MGNAKAWDAARDQQLFLLIVDSMKVDFKLVAKRWAEKYPDDDSAPTASAIGQHIYKLQKANGGGSGGSKPKASVSTPKRSAAVPKTPTSSAKRQKVVRDRNMSDEDDSEAEQDFTNIPKRESTVRRSKANRGAYVEPSSDGDEDEDRYVTSARSESRTIDPAHVNTTGYASPLSKRNSVEDDDEVTVTASRSVGKKPMSNFDYFNQAGDDSDVSDYQPLV
ncbi:hypothetical protein PRZ48_007512 [Zasmidium cellare]|uniref:Uncharacterized protein n=1 Tax=Zasmidium cellare TaxID=395010 RepID=A0ABR0EKN3_ZASCE|nr:hypothetical protein PRZ48_007512 [Zasmidium cellare]